MILNDYKTVMVETGQDIKEKPFKSALIFSTTGLLWYMAKTNPDEVGFQEQIVQNTNELGLLGDAIRNRQADKHLEMLVVQHNAGVLKRFNIGICSFMWIDNYDSEVDLYDARCKHLKVGWLNFKDRIVDIGAFGHWWLIKKAMENYDINPDEWE